ncbi:uncharacterized protein V1516DRAFT_83297 [Lipomyces oligophaga]|uniref:uncharacterized protein n=1 Tax=Lipomyces oligophaga TaxID=45792 RepID=UPI0034CECA72
MRAFPLFTAAVVILAETSAALDLSVNLVNSPSPKSALSDKQGSTFSIILHGLDKVFSSSGKTVAFSKQSLVYDFDLDDSTLAALSTSPNSPVRLAPSSEPVRINSFTTSSVSFDSGHLSPKRSTSSTPATSALYSPYRISADLAVAVAPALYGSKHLAFAMLVTETLATEPQDPASAAIVVEQYEVKADVLISRDHTIKLLNSMDSALPIYTVPSEMALVAADETMDDMLSVSDILEWTCSQSEKPYWCTFANFARSAKSTFHSAVSSYGFSPHRQSERVGEVGAHTSSRPAGHRGRRPCHGFNRHKKHPFDSHSSNGKNHKSGHHHFHRPGNGRNESLTSFMNSFINTLFSFTLPLLLGIFSGTLLVLACVWIADFISAYIIRRRLGSSSDCEYVLVMHTSDVKECDESKELESSSVDSLPIQRRLIKV